MLFKSLKSFYYQAKAFIATRFILKMRHVGVEPTLQEPESCVRSITLAAQYSLYFNGIILIIQVKKAGEPNWRLNKALDKSKSRYKN